MRACQQDGDGDEDCCSRSVEAGDAEVVEGAAAVATAVVTEEEADTDLGDRTGEPYKEVAGKGELAGDELETQFSGNDGTDQPREGVGQHPSPLQVSHNVTSVRLTSDSRDRLVLVGLWVKHQPRSATVLTQLATVPRRLQGRHVRRLADMTANRFQ